MGRNKQSSVLIVDDESININALSEILSPEYTIYIEKNGRYAAESAAKLLPDVILLDIIMPEMNGYEVLTALKHTEKTKNIPVIFITGLDDDEAEEKGLALGAVDYIHKPFSPAIVKLRLKNQINILEQRITEYDLMKYRLMGNSLKVALWDMDIVISDPLNRENEMYFSDEFRRMLGFETEEEFPNLVGSLIDRFHIDDLEHTLEVFLKHLNDRAGKTPYDVIYRLLPKTGDYRYFHAFGDTLRDSKGNPLKTAGGVVDISEKKLLEKNIEDMVEDFRNTSHWYHSILDAIPLPISVTDTGMNWVFVNSALEMFLGKKRDELLGEHCSMINTEICFTDKCGIECAKRGIKHTFFKRGDLSFQASVEILRDTEGNIAGFIEVAQDITEIKNLTKQQTETEIASRAKSAFLANMSHEIRTPMNAILGVTEILMQDEELPERIGEGLDKIFTSCDLLLGIINDILDFSKIEAGKLDITPVEYNIASLVNDSVQLNIMRLGNRPIDFRLLIDENIPTRLIGDELRIKQILNNLLSNAFKYTEQGSVTLSVSFDMQALEISVQDTGYGMTAEQITLLFEEYSRFEQDRRTIEGTGLGLTITQNLVSLMNGEITVDSEPGKGSLFTVRLPQGVADRSAMGRETAESLRDFRMDYSKRKKRADILRDPMPYGSVLVVDDMETNVYVAVGLLKLYKLQIDAVSGGQEAIDLIKSGKTYDVIFMDHMMPMMNGIETTAHLRALGYEKPVVALTADAVGGRAEMFLENGFDAFVSKPIDVRRLNAVLNKFVRDRHPAEVVEAARRQSADKNNKNTEDEKVQTDLLLKSFIKDARKAVKMLDELSGSAAFGDEENLRQFTITVHGIKSSLANIGKNPLSEKAYKLEKAGRERNVELLSSSASGFVNELRQLLNNLETNLNADADMQTGGGGDLREKLAEIKEMCANYDRKGALDILNNIKNYPPLERITEFLLQSEFDEAEATAEEILNNLDLIKNAEIDGLDIIKGIEKFGGDEKIYLKVLRKYAANLNKLLGTLEADAQDNPDNYQISVHGIKGSSFDIFADEIGEKAKTLENAAKENDSAFIKLHNPAFIEAAQELVNNIEALLKKSDAANPKPKRGKPDIDVLLRLCAACRSFSMDEADEAMEELEGFVYEADGELIEWLREKIDLLKFKEIADRLSEIKE